jgi:peptidoglycan/LPS O-acetylase OafA/YrhL
LAALAAYLATEPEFVNPPELVHMRPWVTLAMLVLFTLFVNGKLEWLAVRPLVFVGSISYSFYLLHQYIGVSLIPYLTRGLHLPDLLACTATALVSGLLAFVLTRIVEIPTKAALLRWARAHLFPRLAVVLPGFAFARPPRLGMISRRPVSAVRQPETT